MTRYSIKRKQYEPAFELYIKTTYVLHYTEKMRDTITLIHQNIPTCRI